MELQSITISLSRKINTGNYESAEATAFMSARMDYGESPEAIQKYLIEECNNALDIALSPYKPSAIAKVNELFMGKKIEDEEF